MAPLDERATITGRTTRDAGRRAHDSTRNARGLGARRAAPRHTSTTLIEFPVPKDGRYLLLKGAPPVRLETLNVMTNFPALMEEKLRA